MGLGATSAATAMRSWVLPAEPAPVRLMNTIWADRAGVHDDLSTPADLGVWLQSVSAADRPPHVTRRHLTDARQLRDALRRIAAFVTADTGAAATSPVADVDVAIEIINRAATATPPAPRLTHDRERLRTTAAANAPTVATTLAAVAIAAIDLFASDHITALRTCHAPGCVLYFVKDHPRREWCSNTCGNRARAARHYRKHRSDRAPAPAPLTGDSAAWRPTIYSIRRPEIARLMTSCWISDVPSKIVWFNLSGFSTSILWCAVPPSRNDASARRAS